MTSAELWHRSHRSTLASPAAEDTSKSPPNRPLELKRHRTRGHPPRKAGPSHKYNPKSQVGGVTPMLTAASPLLRPWHTMSRPKRNSRLDSSASWDERVRTPLIYFPLNHTLWRGDNIEGGDPMGWNRVWWWLEWISTVGQGGVGPGERVGGTRGGFPAKMMSAPRQTTSPPTCRLSIAEFARGPQAPNVPR